MNSLLNTKIKFWNDHGKNVLMVGRHGVGKTEIIKESLDQFGLKFGESVAYFSTVSNDFVGDPTTAKVILFDNLNDPAAQKAAHEVSRLKVWKGQPITAYVWGAYTEDHTQDKEDFCPGFVFESFDVVTLIPYRCNVDWFKEKFGEKLTNSAIEWWEGLDDETRNLCSPKRLASALQVYKEKGDVRDILPVESNVGKLMSLLNSGPIVEKLNELLAPDKDEEAYKFLQNANNYAAAMRQIPKSEVFMSRFLPFVSIEKLAVLMDEHDPVGPQVCDFILKNLAANPVYPAVVRYVIESNSMMKAVKRCRRYFNENEAAIALLKKPN